MKISVRVKTNSREAKVERTEDNLLLIHVKSLPIENKANTELIELIAKYFNIQKVKISIVSGHHSKNKIVEIKK